MVTALRFLSKYPWPNARLSPYKRFAVFTRQTMGKPKKSRTTQTVKPQAMPGPVAAIHPPIAFDVRGTPAPKGSSRAMLTKSGHAVNVPGGSKQNAAKMKAWDVNVRDVAADTIGPRASPPFVDVPLSVVLVFRLRRPASHWSKKGGLLPSAPRYPRTKPDFDKLTRATVDSLTGLIFDDDSRIVKASIEKLYASPGNEGATIAISIASSPPEDFGG
jgi:crossover junction endodeoxyribonuclease RusA